MSEAGVVVVVVVDGDEVEMVDEVVVVGCERDDVEEGVGCAVTIWNVGCSIASVLTRFSYPSCSAS